MSARFTVLKARLAIADIDRGYYADHALTLARHPSETDERVMVRLFAFMRHASEHLALANGLTHEEEPDLWAKNLAGEVDLWIEVGLPDSKRIRKVNARAREVVIYSYGGRAAQVWWDAQHDKLQPLSRVSVFELPYEATQRLLPMVQRTMALSFTVQEGQMWVADGRDSVAVHPLIRQAVTESS